MALKKEHKKDDKNGKKTLIGMWSPETLQQVCGFFLSHKTKHKKNKNKSKHKSHENCFASVRPQRQQTISLSMIRGREKGRKRNFLFLLFLIYFRLLSLRFFPLFTLELNNNKT